MQSVLLFTGRGTLDDWNQGKFQGSRKKIVEIDIQRLASGCTEPLRHDQ